MSLIFIFLAKVVEVSLTTLRMVFISRGEKLHSSIIGFVEVVIWLKVASVVLVDINEYPLKMLVYALGFACGSYIGLMIEDKLGLGYSNIQIITNVEDGEALAACLREEGRAVTILNGQGRDEKRIILSLYVKRKNKGVILEIIEELGIKGLVTVSETQKIYGGFGVK